MCLYVDKAATKTAFESNKPSGWVTRYKLIKPLLNDELVFSLQSQVHKHVWVPGVNVSDYTISSSVPQFDTHTGKKLIPSGPIYHGIHVYVSRQAAKQYLNSDKLVECMVAVRCKNSDLIAVGQSLDEVYMEVTITDKEYSRVRAAFRQEINKTIANLGRYIHSS